MRKVIFICFVLMLPASAVRAQTASDILQKVTAVYAGCQSYSDEGSTETRMSIGHTRNTSFRTSFVRPDAFRFDLWPGSSKQGSTSWFVWKSGEVFKVGSFFRDHSSRFDTSLLRMAEFSAGSSLTIPQLLLPTEFRNAELLSIVVEAKLAGTEKVNGRETFRIEGMLLGQTVKIWIDRSEYLILKTYRKLVRGEQSEEATVEYKPKLNVPVRPENLTLPPQPASKKIDGTAVISPLVAGVSSPPELAPTLRHFGSSLSRSPNERVGGAADNRSADEDVVRVDTDLVVCPMLVVDAQGNIVRGLTREDFVVKEDNILQEVATLSLGDNKELARSIVLIIDYSASQLPYIKTSIESAKMLVDKLNPKDRMAIVTDDVRLLVDFTRDKQLLKTQLETLKTSALGGTIGASEQYDALLASLNELFNNEDVRPIIIFQTDGDELELLKGSAGLNPYRLPQKFGLQDILTATEKRRASIYSIISGIKFTGLPDGELLKRARLDWDNRQKANLELMRPRNVPALNEKSFDPPKEFLARYGTQWLNRQTVLMGLAKFSGTVPEFLEDPSQADEIYTRVLNDIDRRYVIGYYPTNRTRDGKRRIVNIAVRDHPEYVVWGQKSYFARKEQ
jgi:VWFA-related protein